MAALYQNAFETELYPSIEEKAANLLYFLIKDHPFVDGCKRIGASIFLKFLNWITMAWMRSILQKNNIEYNKSPDNW
ncbi:Fic family protein [Holdemanella porci]|uniref:Fic family protein n=1 Tax=Holdemanella porci TaxID=2652276 RepID=UPI003AB8EE0A